MTARQLYNQLHKEHQQKVEEEHEQEKQGILEILKPVFADVKDEDLHIKIIPDKKVIEFRLDYHSTIYEFELSQRMHGYAGPRMYGIEGKVYKYGASLGYNISYNEYNSIDGVYKTIGEIELYYEEEGEKNTVAVFNKSEANDREALYNLLNHIITV